MSGFSTSIVKVKNNSLGVTTLVVNYKNLNNNTYSRKAHNNAFT